MRPLRWTPGGAVGAAAGVTAGTTAGTTADTTAGTTAAETAAVLHDRPADGTAWFHLTGHQARLQLWPQKAACDPDRGLLLVADAHLGKAVSFRRLGVPVPEATTDEALARLDGLIAATGASGIVFFGDLLHSARCRRCRPEASAPGRSASACRGRAQPPGDGPTAAEAVGLPAPALADPLDTLPP